MATWNEIGEDSLGAKKLKSGLGEAADLSSVDLRSVFLTWFRKLVQKINVELALSTLARLPEAE